jgi:hypothetical protein
MKAGLVALSSILAPTVANVLVNTVAMALGTFVAASPRRAAKIWGSQRLAKLAPERRASFRGTRQNREVFPWGLCPSSVI